MEPLSPQDPLYQLLGKAKVVEPRPNFTQNVLRAVRQLPQKQSVWERIGSWFEEGLMPRVALAGGVAVLVTMAFVALNLNGPTSSPQSSVADTKPAQTPSGKQSALSKAIALEHAEEIDFAQELDGMNQLTMALAQQDTSTLSDVDLALLLY
jgi:hypothetical protein